MSQSLAMYQSMVEGVLASKDLGRLICAKRDLINLKRERYADVHFRNRLYELIRRINDAIISINLTDIHIRISAAQEKLAQANNIVCHPLPVSACTQADQVRRLAGTAGNIVALMERDHHLSPLLPQRIIEIKRLKEDIDSMSRTTLIVAAIKERQQLLRAQEEERQRQRTAEARQREEQQRQQDAARASELARVRSQFDLAINCSTLEQARHALWVIEQAPKNIQTIMFGGQDANMILARMHQQCESLRREVYGRHGIRDLDTPKPTAAIS